MNQDEKNNKSEEQEARERLENSPLQIYLAKNKGNLKELDTLYSNVLNPKFLL